MTYISRAFGVLFTVVACPVPGMATVNAAIEPTSRTVYVTVTDGKGTPLTDLTPADFTVKEGGKDREIVRAEPATEPMQVALMVEERLVGDGRVRMALFEFVKRLQGSAAIGLITVGLRNQTVVDYTTNLNDLVGGLNRLSLDPDPSSNLTESVLAVAEEIERKRPARPVLVMVAISGGQAGGPSPGHVLTQLRQSGAVMHAVTLAGGEIGGDNPARIADANVREQVLGDGPKQSGGRRHEVPSTGAMAQALQQVASDLLGQYVITYTLPEGVKRDRRLNVSVKRRGVSLRAPSAIPDR